MTSRYWVEQFPSLCELSCWVLSVGLIALFVLPMGCYGRSFQNEDKKVAFKIISCLSEGRGCQYIYHFVDEKNLECRYAKDSPGGLSPELVDKNTGATMSGRDVGKAYYQKTTNFVLASEDKEKDCAVIVEFSSGYTMTICERKLTTFNRLSTVDSSSTPQQEQDPPSQDPSQQDQVPQDPGPQ